MYAGGNTNTHIIKYIQAHDEDSDFLFYFLFGLFWLFLIILFYFLVMSG